LVPCFWLYVPYQRRICLMFGTNRALKCQ
jgi:hypothetical protein